MYLSFDRLLQDIIDGQVDKPDLLRLQQALEVASAFGPKLNRRR